MQNGNDNDGYKSDNTVVHRPGGPLPLRGNNSDDSSGGYRQMTREERERRRWNEYAVVEQAAADRAETAAGRAEEMQEMNEVDRWRMVTQQDRQERASEEFAKTQHQHPYMGIVPSAVAGLYVGGPQGACVGAVCGGLAASAQPTSGCRPDSTNAACIGSGALAGAAIGSAVPVVGTAIGACVGAFCGLSRAVERRYMGQPSHKMNGGRKSTRKHKRKTHKRKKKHKKRRTNRRRNRRRKRKTKRRRNRN